MLSPQEYNAILELLQNSNLSDKKKIHIIGELKRITNHKRKGIIY